jgi:hypothetical protein
MVGPSNEVNIMSVIHYRLCFDAPIEKRFRDKDHFESWFAKHMPNVETFGVGYIILPAHELVHQMGNPCWFVMIHGQESYAPFHHDFMTDLSNNGWKIDGIRALVYIKYPEKNEILFPISAAA